MKKILAITRISHDEIFTLSGSNGDSPLDFFCSASGKDNLNIGDLVVASIKFLKEQRPEVSILKRLQYPKNYIFAVYLHDKTGAKLALLSNKGDKPLSVLPLRMGANFDQKFGYFAIGNLSKHSKNFKIHDFHNFWLYKLSK